MTERKKDGRANNGGARKNAGRRKLDPDDMRVPVSFSLPGRVAEIIKRDKPRYQDALIRKARREDSAS